MKKLLTTIIVGVFLITCVCYANAHSLSSWATQYPASGANSTYSFGFQNVVHINGKNVKYCFDNSITLNYFNSAVSSSFSSVWGNLITGSYVTTTMAANVKIVYDSVTSPAPSYASATITNATPGGTVHYGLGAPATITFYSTALGLSTANKKVVAGHEFGHLWGLADLYSYNSNLASIYSQSFAVYTSATRHDRNAMRIALNNLWFNPGSSQIWKYQSSPGSFRRRGDPDGNGSITSADAQLITNYALEMTTPSTIQSKVSEVDGDGSITTEDARLVLRVAIGTDPKFPLDVNE